MGVAAISVASEIQFQGVLLVGSAGWILADEGEATPWETPGLSVIVRIGYMTSQIQATNQQTARGLFVFSHFHDTSDVPLFVQQRDTMPFAASHQILFITNDSVPTE